MSLETLRRICRRRPMDDQHKMLPDVEYVHCAECGAVMEWSGRNDDVTCSRCGTVHPAQSTHKERCS